MSGLRAWMPRSSGNLRAVDHESCEARALDAGTLRGARRDGAQIPSAWLSRPEVYVIDAMPGAAPAYTTYRTGTRNAAACLLAAFLCAGVAGVGSAAAQSCLNDSNGDGHPLFAGMVGQGEFPIANMQAVPVTSLASGDLNADGFPDAVMTHQMPGEGYPAMISVLLNEGDGMLEAAPSIILAVDAAPRSVQLGRLNGDAFADLVYADESTDLIFVMQGDGAGNFTPLGVGSYEVGNEPSSVIIGDLDGDLDNDLAVLARVSNDVTVWKNNGNGTFTPGGTYPAGNVPDSAGCSDAVTRMGPVMAAADVNGVGGIDLVVPSMSGFSVLRNNNGTGVFNLPLQLVALPFSSTSWTVSVGNLDGNNQVDVVSALPGCVGAVYVSRNNNGTFSFHDRYEVNYYDQFSPGGNHELVRVAIGDLDNDGHKDLVVGHAFRCVEQMLINDGSGSFGPAPENTGGFSWVSTGIDLFPGPLLLDDFDSDGKLDLAVARGWGGAGFLHVILNNGTGSGHLFHQHQRVPDLLDFAGPGTFVYPWYRPVSVAIADFDGDGHDDLAVLDSGTNEFETHLNVLRNPGNGDFTDVAPDVYMLPHVLSDPSTQNVGAEYTAVRAGYLNGDGHLDLVVGESGRMLIYPWGIDFEGSSMWVLMNVGGESAGTFAEPLRYDTTDGDSFGTTDARLGHVDGDQDLDIVIVNSSRSYDSTEGDPPPLTQTRLRVYSNDGVGGLTPGPWLDLGYSIQRASLSLEDLDGQNGPDVVVRTGGEAGIHVFHNDGQGNFGPLPDQSIAPYRAPHSHTLADLDADGYLDLVASWNPTANPEAPGFSIYLNDRNGRFDTNPRWDYLVGPPPPIPFHSFGVALEAGDMDGDGLTDLICGTTTNMTSGYASVWINSGFPDFEVGRYAIDPWLWRVATGDLDGDDDLEIVSCGSLCPNLSILNNMRCSAPAPPLPGDLDGNGCVDIADLAQLLAHFGTLSGATYADGDIDGDGDVDIADLAILLAHFGECIP